MFNSLFFTLVEAVVTFVAIFAVYIRWNHQYWKRRNFPYLEPPFPVGNLNMLMRGKDTLGIRVKKLYNQIKAKGWKHAGFYTLSRPSYMAVDLDFVKNVMTKDFQFFTDRGAYYNERDEPLSAHLFAIGGLKWRNLRTKLSPTFTSGKMKHMFQTLVNCEVPLLKAMEGCHDKHEPVDIKEMFARFTTDIIGSCAFGLECESFKDEQSPFRTVSKKLFERSFLRVFFFFVATSFPSVARGLHLRLLPPDITDFFMKTVRDTVEYREQNHIKRNDFLQMLIEMKSDKDDENHDGTTLTMNEMTAQCFIFFVAGFETSSTTSTFLLYELAQHQDIQRKVRQEIQEVLVRYGGKVTYDAINEMTYMSQVIDETLRKYPPVPMLTRECVKDYTIPDTDLVLKKGIKVTIPILGIHHDPEYYPDPLKFDPERFSDSNRQSRHPYAHIPFGEGPRICIGMRFGLMQTKVGLTALIKNYKFTVSKKTKLPLEFKASSFIPTVEGGLWLDVEQIKYS